jgi:hypothetical protein
MEDKIDQVECELHEALFTCIQAYGLNGPAFYHLSMKIAETGKNLGDLTFTEFREIYKALAEHYNPTDGRC